MNYSFILHLFLHRFRRLFKLFRIALRQGFFLLILRVFYFQFFVLNPEILQLILLFWKRLFEILIFFTQFIVFMLCILHCLLQAHLFGLCNHLIIFFNLHLWLKIYSLIQNSALPNFEVSSHGQIAPFDSGNHYF